jgi:phytoene/squalene synthetase
MADQLFDVREDAANGRVYLPVAELTRAGVDVNSLAEPTLPPGVREVALRHATIAMELLGKGASLAQTLHGWPRVLCAGLVAATRTDLSEVRHRSGDLNRTSILRRPRLLGYWVDSWRFNGFGSAR